MNVVTVSSSWNKGNNDTLLLSCTASLSHGPPDINTSTKTYAPVLHTSCSVCFFCCVTTKPSTSHRHSFQLTSTKRIHGHCPEIFTDEVFYMLPPLTNAVSLITPLHLAFHNRDSSSFHTCSKTYRYALHNNASVNTGPHIQRWPHNITLPTVFSTVTCCTDL
jgi:hypothetical protein